MEVDATQEKIKERKTLTIFGISIWRILAYFIIYSVIGYIVETLYGIATKGVWESRQSFLYGPFCGIYGVGAVIMIIFLQFFSKNHNTLFLGGFIIGSITEYIISFLAETFLHVKWWDYSHMPLNLNGRICVFFSLFWGFLAMYLMGWLNPKIDKIIDRIKEKISVKKIKVLTVSTLIIISLDCIVTVAAINLFLVRMIEINDIDVSYREQVTKQYNKIYTNDKISSFIYKFWGDKKMIKTYPNLKVEDKNGNIIYIDSLLKDIQPYYYKIYDKKL